MLRMHRPEGMKGGRAVKTRSGAFLAAVAAVFVLAGVASADSIGINFYDSSTAEFLVAGDAAGAPGYQQQNWNNVGRWGNWTSVNDDSGVDSGVDISWDAANTWRLGGGVTNTPDQRLMYGYLDATGEANTYTNPYSLWSNQNKPQVVATGLSSWLSAVGASSYKVVIYMDGDATEGRVSEYWVQECTGSDVAALSLGSDLTSHVFVSDVSTFSSTFTLVPLSANSVANAGQGNYVVFEGLTADQFLVRTEEQTFRATINGLQFVSIPEPTTISLLGLVGLAAILRRFRSV